MSNLNPHLAVVYVLVDRSGSMDNMRAAVVSGLNEFIQTQRKVPNMTVVFSIASFDSGHDGKLRYNNIRHFQNVKEIPDITLKDFVPEGGTPLVEAMCRGIDELGEDLASMPAHERPAKVVFLTVTDGGENASGPDFTSAKLRNKIEVQSNTYNWQFAYIGANQDAFAVAASYGISPRNTSNYRATSGGAHYAFAATSNSTANYIGGASASVDLSGMEQDAEIDETDPMLAVNQADLKKRLAKKHSKSLSSK